MRLSIDRKALLEAFAAAASASNPKSPLEILRFVQVIAEGNAVVLIGTDGRRFVRARAEGGTIHHPGRALLDSERCKAALENLASEEVVVEADDKGVAILGGHATLRYPTDDPSKFPEPPTLEADAESWELDSTQLWLLTDRTAAFPDELASNAYALGGVVFDADGEDITFFAASYGRMSIQCVPNPGEPSKVQASIPASVLRLATSLFKEPRKVRIAFGGPNPLSPHRVHISGDGGEVIGQLLEGRIPPWRYALSNGMQGRPDGTAVVDVSDLKRAIRCVATANSEATRGMKMEFDESGLVLASRAADRGDGRVPVDCTYEGGPSSVTVDHRYAAEAIMRLSAGSKVEIQVRGPDEGVLFTQAPGYTHRLQPIILVQEGDPRADVQEPEPSKRRKASAAH